MIFTIFKKELKETLRDRKTIMSMIVIPMLLFPLIFSVMFKVQHAIEDNVNSKEIKIGVIGGSEIEPYLATLKNLPEEFGKRKIIHFTDTSSLRQQIEVDSLQFGLLFPADFEQLDQASKTAQIAVYYKMSELGMTDKIKLINDAIFKMHQSERFQRNNINPETITPYQYDYVNVASDQETLANLVGGFLPYIFIVFGFVGCMYPCIDLFTGEKERKTFETLLTTPVTRWQIMLGKMGVVILSGFLAACFTLFGIFLSLNVFQVVDDPQISEAIYGMFTLKSSVMMLLLLFPLVILFAGVMMPIAINAKSFKEAQSIITPLNMVFIMIAVIGMIPGITLNFATAFIPVVNVVLGMKSLLAGNIQFGLFAITFVIMIVISGISVAFSYRKFDDERNILL